MELRQADLVSDTDLTSKDLDGISPAAAAQLQKARDKMQEARAAIIHDQSAPASQSQQAALQRLQMATLRYRR